jgi:hypothetical protein
MKPVVIGDSHSKLGFSKDKFIVKPFDAKTAYNLLNPNRFEKLKSICLEYKEHTIYSIFGEIDCRMHIVKNNSLNKTINRYFKVINTLRKINKEIWIVSVSPQEVIVPDGYYGASYEERKNTILKFNELLSSDSKFVNIYDNLVDENGFRKKEYIKDPVHCNDKIGDFVYESYRMKRNANVYTSCRMNYD